MPIAFMVMPYGKRPTGATVVDAPQEVDFDRLWMHVYTPVLEELGYSPLRADFDGGSMVIRQMLQRLVLGEMVVADLTIANANVYYELGIRHAAREHGCVLSAADWSVTVFDVEQLRRFPYPLVNGDIDEETAEQARVALSTAFAQSVVGGSPVHEAVPGYPRHRGQDLPEELIALAGEHHSFMAGVRAAYAAPVGDRGRLAAGVLAQQIGRPRLSQADARTLLVLARDLLSWNEVLELTDRLGRQFPHDPWLVEQRNLAVAKVDGVSTERLLQAVGELITLIETSGGTAERWGLLGGRYKQLRDKHTTAQERDHYLRLMIEAYENGMSCDLNTYYPATNLPGLYWERGDPGDHERADRVLALVTLACQRALDLKIGDEWLRQTLLGAAFARGDVAEAQRLHDEVALEGHAQWKLQTTINGLARLTARHSEPTRTQLHQIIAGLQALLPGHTAKPVTGPVRTEPVYLDNYAQIGPALTSLGIATGRPVVVIVGGAGGLSDEVAQQVGVLFEQLVPVFEEKGVAVIDGGTDAGVMSLIGKARSTAGAAFPLIGVAARGTIQGGGPSTRPDAAALEPNHSHVLLVPGEQWGAESPWIARVATELAQSAHSCTLVANGGSITYQDITRSLEEGRPVIVLAGTGRTADEITSAVAGEPASEEIKRIAGSPYLRVAHADRSALRAALDAVL